MLGAVVTLAVVLAVSACACAAWYGVAAAMRRMLGPRAAPRPGGPHPRLAEVEAALAAERGAHAALRENHALALELCRRYEAIIETFSPGLLQSDRDRPGLMAGGPAFPDFQERLAAAPQA